MMSNKQEMHPVTALVKFCSVLLVALLYLTARVDGHCSPEQIAVDQSQEMGDAEGMMPWNVTIHNSCPCSILDLKLSCRGFDQIALEMDPAVLSETGDECLVNKGLPLYPFSSFSFVYFSQGLYPFQVLSFSIACS